jgi:hypothetical protein
MGDSPIAFINGGKGMSKNDWVNEKLDELEQAKELLIKISVRLEYLPEQERHRFAKIFQDIEHFLWPGGRNEYD